MAIFANQNDRANETNGTNEANGTDGPRFFTVIPDDYEIALR